MLASYIRIMTSSHVWSCNRVYCSNISGRNLHAPAYLAGARRSPYSGEDLSTRARILDTTEFPLLETTRTARNPFAPPCHIHCSVWCATMIRDRPRRKRRRDRTISCHCCTISMQEHVLLLFSPRSVSRPGQWCTSALPRHQQPRQPQYPLQMKSSRLP